MNKRTEVGPTPRPLDAGRSPSKTPPSRPDEDFDVKPLGDEAAEAAEFEGERFAEQPETD